MILINQTNLNFKTKYLEHIDKNTSCIHYEEINDFLYIFNSNKTVFKYSLETQTLLNTFSIHQPVNQIIHFNKEQFSPFLIMKSGKSI